MAKLLLSVRSSGLSFERIVVIICATSFTVNLKVLVLEINDSLARINFVIAMLCVFCEIRHKL